MGDLVYFDFYDKKEPNRYDSTIYRIPADIFYNLLNKRKKDYLKLFTSIPEQIMKYLDKIDRVEKERRIGISEFPLSLLYFDSDSIDNKDYFYIVSIPYIIKRKYSNTQSGVVLIVTKDKNDKGNKLAYFNIPPYGSGFKFIKKIDPAVDPYFDMTLCKFNLNKEIGEVLEGRKYGIINPTCDIYAINIPSELSYDYKSYKTKITFFDVLDRKSLINTINYKDEGLIDFIKNIQRDCGEDDINLKFKIDLDYCGINDTHVMIQFVMDNVNMNNTFENYEYTMSVFKENKSKGVHEYSKCLMNNKKISYNRFVEELRDILIV